MLASAPIYDPGYAHDLSIVVAGVVPVILVAAFAVPVRRVRNVEEAKSALVELLAAGVLLALALVTEMLALFGVAYGLGHTDQGLLFWTLFLTAIAATRRMIAPLVHTYAEDRRIPAGRIWGWLGVATIVVSVAMTVLLVIAEHSQS